MEQERPPAERRGPVGDDAGADDRVNEERTRLEAMLAQADKLLDSLSAGDAEEYLQQSKQKPAE